MKAVQNIWILFDLFVAILQLSGRVYSILRAASLLIYWQDSPESGVDASYLVCYVKLEVVLVFKHESLSQFLV